MTRKEQSERKMACVEMAREGNTFKEIADYFGLNENSVRQTCAKYGIRQYKNGRKPPANIDKKTVIELLKQGKKPKDVAEIIGCNAASVSVIAKESGLNNYWFNLKTEKYRAYKALGYSLAEVAEHFGVGVSEVQRACAGMPKKANVKEPWNKGLHTGKGKNQFTNGKYDQLENAKIYIHKANPDGDIEYYGGFISLNDFVDLKCNICGSVFTRHMNSIRHGMKTICPVCAENARKQKAEMLEKNKKMAKAERHEIAIKNKATARENRLKATKERQEARRHNCPVCGVSTTRPKYCSDKCSRIASQRKYYTAHEARRRSRIQSQIVDKDITLRKLFDRDGGRCWICGMMCDYSDITYTDAAMIAGNIYPSIDHIIPLSEGGQHSWENVKLAHRICNTYRYYAPHSD